LPQHVQNLGWYSDHLGHVRNNADFVGAERDNSNITSLKNKQKK